MARIIPNSRCEWREVVMAAKGGVKVLRGEIDAPSRENAEMDKPRMEIHKNFAKETAEEVDDESQYQMSALENNITKP